MLPDPPIRFEEPARLPEPLTPPRRRRRCEGGRTYGLPPLCAIHGQEVVDRSTLPSGPICPGCVERERVLQLLEE